MKAGSAQRGISLVELMVAMAISLVLLLGIVQILLGHRGSFDSQQALAGLQQRGRLASFVLENAIAYAGYYPIQTGMHQVPAPESVESPRFRWRLVGLSHAALADSVIVA